MADNKNQIIESEQFQVSYTREKRIVLVQGDILSDSTDADVLLCSAFSGSYEAYKGTLIGKLNDIGVSVKDMASDTDPGYDIYDDSGKKRCWISKEINNPHFRRLACVELLPPSNGEENQAQMAEMDYLKNVFVMLRRMLVNFSDSGQTFKKLVMVTPGTGNQKLETEFVATVLFAQLRLLLKNAEELTEIAIYEKDPNKIAVLKAFMEGQRRTIGKQVFVSYSSKDADWAEKITKYLREKGIICWKAPEDIPTGSNYQIEIPKGLRETYILLVILTENSEKSKWCYKEIGSAIGSGHIVVPVKIDDYASTDQFNFLMDGEQIYPAYRYILNEGEDKMLEKLSKIILRFKQNHEAYVN